MGMSSLVISLNFILARIEIMFLVQVEHNTPPNGLSGLRSERESFPISTFEPVLTPSRATPQIAQAASPCFFLVSCITNRPPGVLTFFIPEPQLLGF
jgi:hypothetical protein